MALHPLMAFGAGELDPALWDRTTLDKYRTGLATARNCFIHKTGRIVNRGGTSKILPTKNDPTMAPVTFVRFNANYVTASHHHLGLGTKVRLTTTGTLPGGLSLATDYYVIYVAEDTLAFASSLANAKANTVVTTSNAGTGVHTIVPVSFGATSSKCVLYSPPYSKYLIEWGHRYVRIHDTENGTYQEAGQNFTEDDLPYVQFKPSGLFVYVFCRDYLVQKMVLGDLSLSSTALTYHRMTPNDLIFYVPFAPISTSSSSTGTPNGYDVDYAWTQVVDGQEGDWNAVGGFKLPISNGQYNTFGWTGLSTATEVRVYRRPSDGQAYGYIGSVAVVGGTATFNDYGQEADYTHSPPKGEIMPYLWYITPQTYKMNTGTIYQQRLVTTWYKNEEAIVASRPGAQNNFWRDYPLAADSALQFKTGAEGIAKVLHIDESDGLLAFTTRGIFKSTGALTPDNLAMPNAGEWVIKETLKPLKIPGGMLFQDQATNTVRILIYSNDTQGYPGDEISIYSNHLFENKEIVSWAFQDGDAPIIWCVMSDGSVNTLTYQRDQQMRAWTRHDTQGGKFESVATVRTQGNAANRYKKSTAYFVVLRNGLRYIEKLEDRFENDLKDLKLMDASVSLKNDVTYDDTLTATAQDPSDWYGLIDIYSSFGAFNNVAGEGAVGTIFRMFDKDGAALDLEVITRTDFNTVTVQPLYGQQFPPDQSTGFRLYRTYTEVTGLDHLEGQSVTVFVDGNLLSSPLNDDQDYDPIVVNGGKITLPVRDFEQMRGAFITVGLPIVSDVETLDVATLEQKPTMVEDLICSKLYMRVHKTLGTYVSSEFPANNFVKGMTTPDEREENNETGNIGNAAQKPISKRYAMSIPNDWKSRGRICLRQVDPYPFEILSFLPDFSTS